MEQVKFAFDPMKSDNPEIIAVFNDDLAKTIWIAIKRNHLVSESFNKNCLRLASELRKTKNRNITGKQLNDYLSWLDMIGTKEDDVGDKILPYIRGEQKFKIVVKE